MKNQKLLLLYFKNIILFLFVFLLPTQFGKHFFLPFSYISGVRIDYLAPTVYVTDILTIFLVTLHSRDVLHFFKKGLFLYFVFFICLNILFSLSPLISLYRFFKIIEFLIIVAVFKKEYPTRKNLIMQAFLCGLLLQFILVITQFTVKHSLQGIWYFLGERYIHLGLPDIAKASINGAEFLRPYGTFSHPNSMAGFYLMLSLFILTNKSITNLFFKYVFLLFSACIIILSFSKATLIIFGLLLLYYFASFSIRCRICFAAKFVTIGTIILLFMIVQTDPLSFQKRTELISDAFNIIMQFPLLGTGIGNYLHAQINFPIRYPYFFLQPVHNIFLLLIAETGIPFGLFFIGKIVIIFANTIRKSLMLLPFLAVVFTGMIDHYWFTLQQNILLLAVMSGIFLSDAVLLKNGE